MIRINLLPVRQAKKVAAGQRQLLLLIGLIVVEVAGLVVLYNIEEGAIEEKKRTVATLEQEIEALKREVGDYERLQSQRQQLIAQRNVINALNESRIGPVWVLREVGALLSVNGRPTIDQQSYDDLIRRHPSAAFNIKWNPRRLWLSSFTETGKGVSIIGKAKDYDDVAELLKRLGVSRYFDNVQLIRNNTMSEGKLQVVQFSLSAGMKYKLAEAPKATAAPESTGEQPTPGASPAQRGIDRLRGNIATPGS